MSCLSTARSRVRRGGVSNRFAAWLLALLAISFGGPVTAAPPAGQTGVTAVATTAVGTPSALDANERRTRFVIGLERAVDFQIFALSEPNRVIVDLPDVKVQFPTLPNDGPVGLVRSFRAGLSAPKRMRIVIDVTGPVVIERAQVEASRSGGKTAELAVELIPAASIDSGAQVAQARPLSQRPSRLGAGTGRAASSNAPTVLQPPTPRLAVKPPSRRKDNFRQIIVIDPGHGGHDSGAIRNGVVEKEVVLAFSLKLREKLEATGRYRVLMTRDTDRFVPLDERRAFADNASAALYLSVHADYASSSASGATIYSLRESTARQLMPFARDAVREAVLSSADLQRASAAASNRSDGAALQGFLADLALREVENSRHLTREFADAVVTTMGQSTNLMNNPDREANFRVLKSVKMPSVLIELAYVTNRRDAANLKSDAWRDRVADSIVAAVDNYFAAHVSRLVQ